MNIPPIITISAINAITLYIIAFIFTPVGGVNLITILSSSFSCNPACSRLVSVFNFLFAKPGT